jgi:hypothetical protein
MSSIAKSTFSESMIMHDVFQVYRDCKLERLQVKFFTDVYDSDVIVASPLALATQLAEGGAGAADYLSSIELLVMFRGDVMQMQNWSHVETVFEALNKMPSEQHGTDIMRVRCVCIPYTIWYMKKKDKEVQKEKGETKA